jgi:hypothetical protein
MAPQKKIFFIAEAKIKRRNTQKDYINELFINSGSFSLSENSATEGF